MTNAATLPKTRFVPPPKPKKRHLKMGKHTVDGRNPAPPRMYKNPVITGISTTSTGAGVLPSTV